MKYPGQNAVQIIIRPKESFHICIRNLSRFLFGGDEVEDLIKTCRVAVFWNLGILNRSADDYYSFEDDLKKLCAQVKSSKIDLDI